MVRKIHSHCSLNKVIRLGSTPATSPCSSEKEIIYLVHINQTPTMHLLLEIYLYRHNLHSRYKFSSNNEINPQTQAGKRKECPDIIQSLVSNFLWSQLWQFGYISQNTLPIFFYDHLQLRVLTPRNTTAYFARINDTVIVKHLK